MKSIAKWLIKEGPDVLILGFWLTFWLVYLMIGSRLESKYEASMKRLPANEQWPVFQMFVGLCWYFFWPVMLPVNFCCLWILAGLDYE